MNKVTAESRERDSAVTLFGPGDYCALTVCSNPCGQKRFPTKKDGKRFLCSKCLHCNSGQRVMQVVSARTAVQRLRCYRQRIQSSSLYALNMVICHNQIIRNFLICHGTVHIRPWSASAVCEINKRSRRVLSVFCNRPINRREFFCAFFSKQNAASCG